MRKIFTICILTLLGANLQAQMKDITVTLQPTASYTWFDDNSAIEDGVMYGGRVGFGFGEAIELRALYEKSTDINNTVDDFDIFSDDFVSNFTSRNVDIERIGGEFKANIPTRGRFVPYILLGAGVQQLKFDIAAPGDPSNEQELEQIYGNLGLGTQIKLGNRLFLNLEAKNTAFNLNPASVLFQEGQDQSEFEDLLNDNNNSRMYNWSVLAGLQLYLGGRSPEDFSDLDRAYYNKFSGGLRGFKFILEPAGSFVNFDSDSNLADAYFIGGKIGFDLNQYVGIRGFYYQAIKDEKISTDWDDLAMYGADFVAKLNVSRGVVPYISFGGGYLNANDNSYVGKDGLTGAPSSYFAKGGLGLNVPLGRNIEAFGDANLLFTSERGTTDLENTVSPDELKQHTMFTVGLRFQLGKKADNTDDILQSRIDQRVEDRTQAYQDRIDELESELSEAYENNDTQKAVEIIEEKKELERIQKSDPEMKSAREKDLRESKVEMTPKELEELIEKVIQGVDEESRKPQTIEDRMDRLERLLLELNTGTYKQNLEPASQEDASQKVLDKLKDLDRKIDKNTDKINDMEGTLQNQGQDKTVVITGGQQTPTGTLPSQPTETTVETDQDGNTVVKSESSTEGFASGWVINEGLSVFTGAVFADDVSVIIGMRGNYAFTNSPFKFMPDIYLAPGKNTGFGINANVVIPFEVDAGVILNPYAGLGLGYNDAVGESTFSPNLILGTSFNLLGGKLFADYTAHNFIDIHRISVGYKLKF
ncbi:MAG: outer membrane beta-barrel protein [Bacteroidota bacterium]